MENNSSQMRQKIIQEIFSQKKFKKQMDLQFEMEERSIEISQSTLSRDMKEMGIKKNQETGFLELGKDYNIKSHLGDLHNLLYNNSQYKAVPNVKVHYIQSPKGKAQEISFHLEEAFPTIVLKTIVDISSIIIFADEEVLKNQKEESQNYKRLLRMHSLDE